MVELEVDGKKVEMPEGSMIIEAAHEAGVYVPRFCYHKKLSIVASCRMCLVEVEKIGKPIPACATPVTPGMKVMTRSAKALHAQKVVMEFLLVNHPLDCPICDQGGECELQDLSMGFGRGFSDYTESKRAVEEELLGPLVETAMTRCIHCTRCVRFGEEIAGIRELGATDRGEAMKIGTYLPHVLSSELSGNIIDLCPVGALVNKPARYTGRGYEYTEHPMVSPHDSVGSHLFVHTRAKHPTTCREVMRVVPREHDALNETWIADRDRYSCHGLYHPTRLYRPRVRRAEGWVDVDWHTALQVVVDGLETLKERDGGASVAGIAGYTATLEEYYLLQKLIRAWGSPHVDHRVREQDVHDQLDAPTWPGLENLSVAELETQDTIFLVGSNVRESHPIISHRIHQAVENGGKVMALHSRAHPFVFPLRYERLVPAGHFLSELAELVRVAEGAHGDAEQTAMIALLRDAEKAVILMGEQGLHHTNASQVRGLVRRLSVATGARLGFLTDGPNAAGAWIAGAVPHRTPGGKPAAQIGRDANSLLATNPVPAYVLWNVEPEYDAACPVQALRTLMAAEFVACFTSFVTPAMESYAQVLLPIAPFVETAGTYVNLEGQWQSFSAVTESDEVVKPGWKVLRVLGNLLELPGFDYQTAHEVREAVRSQCGELSQHVPVLPKEVLPIVVPVAGLTRLAPWPIYRVDALVRRSEPLQAVTAWQCAAAIAVHPDTAIQLGLTAGEYVTAVQQGSQLTLPLICDVRLAHDTVWLPSALSETSGFGQAEGPIVLKRGDVCSSN